MKRVAIVQSSYVPWKGYFDIINMVDEFIIYDEVQFTKRDWRNRNKIKTAKGTDWLTIPVVTKGRYEQRIRDTEIADPWADQHWTRIEHSYRKARHFQRYCDDIKALYATASEKRLLSEVNLAFLAGISRLVEIQAQFKWSDEYESHGTKTERLVSLCKAAGATSYLSGPSARDYIDAAMFENAGIELVYMDYSGYPEYTQLYPPFEHGVTILDLIFNQGEASPKFMKSFGRAQADVLGVQTV